MLFRSAESEEELKSLLRKVKEESEKVGEYGGMVTKATVSVKNKKLTLRR